MNYKQSPLPFQGQKRRFLKAFKQALNSFKSNATFVDLFGGSGLLSHTVKQYCPDAKVIWNDYDNYLARLKAIPQTNALLAKIRPILKDISTKGRIPERTRKNILEIVKKHEQQHGYVDYITLSASLLFSGKYAIDFEQLIKQTMYNRIRKSDFDASGYLAGVERISSDYKEVFERYKSDSTVFLVDPPYLSTDTSTYNSDSYWRLRDYLDVLNVLDGTSYIYFTSNKSQVIELCEWVETRTYSGNPFEGSTVSTTAAKLNHQASYTDIMLYKR